jgi:hypothetical protein
MPTERLSSAHLSIEDQVGLQYAFHKGRGEAKCVIADDLPPSEEAFVVITYTRQEAFPCTPPP